MNVQPVITRTGNQVPGTRSVTRSQPLNTVEWAQVNLRNRIVYVSFNPTRPLNFNDIIGSQRQYIQLRDQSIFEVLRTQDQPIGINVRFQGTFLPTQSPIHVIPGRR